MNLKLASAFKDRNYELILSELKPLFYKNLRGVPKDLHDDFLQEYRIACIKLVDNFHYVSMDCEKDW